MFQLFNKKYNHISRSLKKARKLLLDGNAKGAHQAVVAIRNKKKTLLKKAGDVVLLRDIYISAGYARTAQAIIHIAVKKFPADIFVQLSGLMLKSQRQNSMGLLQQAKALEKLCKNPDDIALWHAANAQLSASLGMMETSAEWLAKTEPLLGKKYTEAWYHYCLTHLLRRDWVKAVEVTQAMVNIESNLKNKILLIRALLSKGDLTKAKKYIQSVDANKGQFYLADSLSVQFYYFLGDIDAAINRLESLQDHWPEIPASSIESASIQLYWLKGDVESAKALSIKTNDPFLKILKTANPNAERKLITLPVMTQEPLMCLPTTVAMAAAAYGIDLSAADLFRDMRGSDGTEIWRMQHHMESLDFDVVYICPSYDIVKQCLDKGQPLIGSKVTLFNAHVEVIAGYDEGLEGVFIRDPESLTPSFVKKDYLYTAYEAAGNYLIAIAPTGALEWLPKIAVNHDASNLIQLKKLIALGELDKARLCFNTISDNCESAYYRDLYAFGAFLSPRQFLDSMKDHSLHEGLNEILKLHSVINTQDSVLIQDWIADCKNRHGALSTEFTQYLEILLARSRRDYAGVLDRLDSLLAKFSSTETLWSYKAEAELEVGELKAAKKSIKIALDLSPKSYEIKRKIRQISPYQESYNDKLSLLKKQIEEYPGIFELEEEIADLLLEGKSGLEYEQAIKACIAKRPLLPWNYNKLASWYLQQDREDLAKNILDQGRALLSEDELPKLNFEQDQKVPSENESDTHCDKDTADLVSDNTEEKEEYLRDIIKNWFNRQFPTENEIARLKNIKFSDPKYLEESKLSWWEHAYVIGISFAINDRETEYTDKAHVLTDSLPVSLPHKTQQMLIAINQAVEIYPLSSEACRYLYDWEMEHLEGEAEWHYTIAFDLAYFQELSGFLNQAEARYKDIITKYPGYHSAYYRLACVYNKKGMKNEAVQQYKSCISIAPSHFGSISSLIDTLTNLNDIVQAKEWCQYKLDINPYSFNCIEQWLLYVAHVEGIEQAWLKLEEVRSNLTPSGDKALSARLLEKKGRYQEAIGLLKQIKDSKQFERHILITHIRCAIGEEKWDLVLQLTDEALKNNPTDIWFIEAKVTALEYNDDNYIHKYIAEQFANNLYSENLASAWLRAILRYKNDTSYVEENLITILNAINDTEIKFYVMHYFSGYFAQYSYGSGYLEWLKMCDRELPNSLYFVESIVDYYRAIGRLNDAINTAEKYYDNNRDNAKAILLYGRILEDENPKIALKYLRKAYNKSGSVECLSRIGRTYHNLGKYKEAKKAYWEVLSKNPFDDLSINNLIVLGEDPITIYPYIVDAINNGIGHNTEYFLVSAVKTAIKLKTTVPQMWIELAEARFIQLQSVQGYGDEMPCMAKAIYEWHMYMGDIEKAEGILQQADIRKPIIGSFKWPGKKWIPGD